MVYRATQETLGREAAVKVVASTGRSEGVVMRFLREVKIASQLDHPFAAHIYAFGAEPDILWVAMEFVHGTSLDRLLTTEGPLPLRRFLPLLERLCEVVHTAHEQGIVHRDIKPANVMVLSRAGRLLPKLLDLGIAKAMSEGASLDAADAELVPFYAQPEISGAAREADTRQLSMVPAPELIDSIASAPLDMNSLRPGSMPSITARGAVGGPRRPTWRPRLGCVRCRSMRAWTCTRWACWRSRR